MELLLVGVSHHQTPVGVRERLAAANEQVFNFYEHYRKNGILRECLVLSTCNRLEIYAIADNSETACREIIDSFLLFSKLSENELLPYVYVKNNHDALRHIFRVASSLDSMVLGEPQILGQVKEAFRQSLDHRYAGPIITKLMHKSFQAAKKVRSETCLTGGTVSISSAAVVLAKRSFPAPLRQANIVILGAGHMASLAAAHLKGHGAETVTIINRTETKALSLAIKHGANALAWSDLPKALEDADIVISATGANAPILTPENMPSARKESRPLLIIDIGVPRDISPELSSWPGIVLKNIDALNEVVYLNKNARAEETVKAEAIIDVEMAKFKDWVNLLDVRPTIKSLAQKAENIRRLELQRTVTSQNFTDDQIEALESMTNAMVRRLLHDPLSFVKKCSPYNKHQGSCDSRGHCLNAIRRAFNLNAD